MPRGTGSGSIHRRGQIWWCRLYVDGKPVDKSSKSSDYEVAKRLLAKMNGQKARGELGGAGAKLTMNAILDYYLEDQALRVKPETLKIEKLVVDAHLRPQFGKLKAEKITSAALANYRLLRSKQKASPTTCNRELSYLRTAMRTAAGTTPPMLSLSSILKFPIVSRECLCSQGFIEDAGHRRRKHC